MNVRIKEHRGKFTIQRKSQPTLFGKPFGSSAWLTLNEAGLCYDSRIPIPIAYFDTLEQAQEQIKQWQEKPKYHYL